MAQPTAAAAAPTWEQVEAEAEAALRQRDLEGYELPGDETSVDDVRLAFVRKHISDHHPTWFERMRRRAKWVDGESPLSLTCWIICTVRVPRVNHPGVVAAAVNNMFHLATPDDADELDGRTDYSDYVRTRIPLPLLVTAAREQPPDPAVWPWGQRAERALRQGFPERFAIQRSNIAGWMATGGPGHASLGTPMARLVTQFMSARIDASAPVPLYPVRTHAPYPPPAPAAAAGSKRGADDTLEKDHPNKRDRK